VAVGAIDDVFVPVVELCGVAGRPEPPAPPPIQHHVHPAKGHGDFCSNDVVNKLLVIAKVWIAEETAARAVLPLPRPRALLP
jgi:hypothetical protein